MKTGALLVQMAMALGAALCFSGTAAAQLDSPMPRGTLAVVNSNAITRAQIDKEIQLLMVSPVSNLMMSSTAQANALEAELLELLIERELLLESARVKQIRIASRAINDAIGELKSRLGGAAKYARYLSDAHLSESQLKERLHQDLVINRLLRNEALGTIRVSEAELLNYYTRYPEDFIRREQVRALHILVAVSNENRRTEALSKIRALEAQLARGSDFGALALEHSECPSITKGGDLGYFSYEQVIPDFADVVFALKPGQVSDVVLTRFGYHLIKLVDRKPPSQIPFKDVREKIRNTIRLTKENRALKRYLAELKNNAEIIRYAPASIP